MASSSSSSRHLFEDKARSNMVVSSSNSSAGFYNNPNIHMGHHHNNPIHGYETNPAEIFNLTTGMEMIGFSRNLQQQQHDHHHHHHQDHDDDEDDDIDHDQFRIGVSDQTTSSENQNQNQNQIMVGVVPDSSWNHHHPHPHPHNNNNLLVDVDDSSIRCVFPCEGNERPSQGLSLSLSSANPSSIGLQSFELRQTTNLSNLHHQQGQQFQMRNSKYLEAIQELLNEFCSLGTSQIIDQQKTQKRKTNWDDYEINNNSTTSSRKQSLGSLEFMELQKRKTKLLSMLEEVDRRYRHYCDQMKAVVSNFEGVAGAGAATVYLSLASKAMSRHFRCLKDGILGQIYATKKAMGEKDPVAPGTTRGETPRLKVLDQTLRQQRAIQQMTMMESHPWRPQRGLPERSVSVLRAWLFEHFLHPYPSDVDKHILARQTGLSRSQVSNWFINARVRLWKPMIEEMYTEESKDHHQDPTTIAASSDGIPDHHLEETINNTSSRGATTDQKPTADQLLRIDSECLSSIISSNPDSSSKIFGTSSSSAAFGAVELDFSSYNHHHSGSTGGISYPNHHQHHQNLNFNGGDVSLTLGLQQHGESGVSLAFSPASHHHHQSSLFYSRDHIDDQVNEYSILDGDQVAQNLPYRNLMGAQLLHDLAG